MNNNVYAIIPARGGSKGVPGKNIRYLASYPLIAYSIVIALKCPSIERVIVSTDSEEIANISKQYGAEVPFLRPVDISGDISTDKEFFLHAINWFEKHEQFCPEYWVHLRPTTPLRETDIVENAIKTMLRNENATSLRSAHEAPESPYKWFKIGKNGYFEGINSSDKRPEYYNLPRQELEKVYIPDGYVDLVRSSFMKSSNSLHGDKMISYISPYCEEVDTEDDFQRLEYQVNKKNHLILDYLK